ncbi:MAG: response regulator [Chloroflexaceae bacterium]|nr:response regulator [Chloroflexaceae bacterium]
MVGQGSGRRAVTVLVIEDEPQIHRFLRASLTSNGYHLLEAMTGQEGLTLAAVRQPDLIILDLGLPDMDGLEVTRRLREWSTTPMIVLSARGQEQDKIDALDAGADDYLTKPFGVGELMARMRVALRQAARAASGTEEPVFGVGGLRVDLSQRRVFVEGTEVHLTPREYGLLVVLVRFAGRVVTHRQLLQEAWGPGYAQESHYLRVYMGHLRRKLEANPARPRYLLTEPGVGYRLASE